MTAEPNAWLQNLVNVSISKTSYCVTADPNAWLQNLVNISISILSDLQNSGTIEKQRKKEKEVYGEKCNPNAWLQILVHDCKT